MARLIEYASILGAIVLIVAFGFMAVIAAYYPSGPMPATIRQGFIISAQVFVFSVLWSFVMGGLGAWYDRVQSRRERSMWNGELIHPKPARTWRAWTDWTKER